MFKYLEAIEELPKELKGSLIKVLELFREEVAETVKRSDFEELKAVVNAETDGIGADLVVVTAPSLEAYKSGLSICRKGGKLCVFAPTSPGKYLQISPKELFFSEIQIIPSYSTSHLETRKALELMKTGRLKVKELITHRFRLANAAKAFKTALEDKESLKVIVLNQ